MFSSYRELTLIEIWAWLPAVLLLGPVGMYLGILAVRHAHASMLGPYTLLRLVVGLLGAVLIFHEQPDIFSVVGATLILGSCALATGIGARRPPLLERVGARLRKPLGQLLRLAAPFGST